MHAQSHLCLLLRLLSVCCGGREKSHGRQPRLGTGKERQWLTGPARSEPGPGWEPGRGARSEGRRDSPLPGDFCSGDAGPPWDGRAHLGTAGPTPGRPARSGLRLSSESPVGGGPPAPHRPPRRPSATQGGKDRERGVREGGRSSGLGPLALALPPPLPRDT